MKMARFICVTSCYWGPKPGHRQSWAVGEVFDGEKCDSPHFIEEETLRSGKQKQVKKDLNYMDKEPKDWTPDDMALATKKELNKVLRGKEYWFDADECMERYEKLQAKREKLAKKADLLALHNQRAVLESHIEMVDALIEDASK